MRFCTTHQTVRPGTTVHYQQWQPSWTALLVSPASAPQLASPWEFHRPKRTWKSSTTIQKVRGTRTSLEYLKNCSTKEPQVLLVSYQWCLRMSMVDTYINGTAPNSPFFQSKFYDHKLVLPKLIKQTKPKMINITGFLSATCGR